MSLDPQITDLGSKVRLTWTPDLSGQGYRLYVDGVAVSRTFKPEASSTTFNKPDTGTHRYGVQKMDVVDELEEVAFPTAPPPPTGEFGGLLPPALPESTGQIRSVSSVAQLQSAISAAVPGDIIRLSGGEYVVSLSVSKQGTASAPITFESAPGAQAVIRAASTRPLNIGSSGAYLRFRRLRFTGNPATSGGNIDVYGHHIEILECEVDDSRDQGIYFNGGSHHCRVERCFIHDNGLPVHQQQGHGIYLQGDDHAVLGNLIQDHGTGFGIHRYDEGARALIAGNTVLRSAHDGIVVGGTSSMSGERVVNNVCAHNGKRGIGHASVCPTSSWADRNVLHANSQGAFQSGCSGFVDRGHREGDPAADAVGYALPEYCLPVLFDGSPRTSADCGID